MHDIVEGIEFVVVCGGIVALVTSPLMIMLFSIARKDAIDRRLNKQLQQLQVAIEQRWTALALPIHFGPAQALYLDDLTTAVIGERYPGILGIIGPRCEFYDYEGDLWFSIEARYLRAFALYQFAGFNPPVSCTVFSEFDSGWRADRFYFEKADPAQAFVTGLHAISGLLPAPRWDPSIPWAIAKI